MGGTKERGPRIPMRSAALELRPEWWSPLGATHSCGYTGPVGRRERIEREVARTLLLPATPLRRHVGPGHTGAGDQTLHRVLHLGTSSGGSGRADRGHGSVTSESRDTPEGAQPN